MGARRVIGWMTGVAFAAGGARRAAVRRLRAGARLPVVVHALPAPELDAILAWLRRNGVLDSLWLSFDDGWYTFRDCIPVLEKFNVRAKLFIAPGQTLRGNVWTDEARQLGVPDAESRSWYPLDESARSRRLDDAANCGKEQVVRRLLTPDEVKAVAAHPLIDVENHTWSHLSAPHRPIDEVVSEIVRAQETLSEWAGRSPEWLAWPFGRGTPALDAHVAALGLRPVYTRKGFDIGPCRNMAIEGVSFQENLGRVLGAWPRVGETL